MAGRRGRGSAPGRGGTAGSGQGEPRARTGGRTAAQGGRAALGPRLGWRAGEGERAGRDGADTSEGSRAGQDGVGTPRPGRTTAGASRAGRARAMAAARGPGPGKKERRGGRGRGGREVHRGGEDDVEGAIPVGDEVEEEGERAARGRRETCARVRGEREVVWGGGGADGWAPQGGGGGSNRPRGGGQAAPGGAWLGRAPAQEGERGKPWLGRVPGCAAPGRGERGRKGKRFSPSPNLFSKCMISPIHSTTKINAWSSMVQQPKDLTLGFYLHEMSS
jgi:hypothetical protein